MGPAGNTAIMYAADDPGLAADILPIVTQICRLAHSSYLDMAERVGDTLHKLPENTSQFRSDHEIIGYGYSITHLALLSDEGSWSRLDRGDEEKLECYFLSGNGSVIADMQTSKVTFRFVTDNDEAVPRSWGTPPGDDDPTKATSDAPRRAVKVIAKDQPRRCTARKVPGQPALSGSSHR